HDRHSPDRATALRPDQDRNDCERRRQSSSTERREGHGKNRTQNPRKSEDPAKSVTHFHRTTRAFAPSRDDPRRGIIDPGEATQATARPTNDAQSAPGTRRWAQFFASVARDAANLSATLCQPRGRRRSERRSSGDTASAGQTSDAGQRAARSRATSDDLSRSSRGRRRRAHHNLHYLHGAAADRFHVANWRRASVA